MHEPTPTPQPNDRGASLAEYALLVALIAVVCLSAVNLLGRSTKAQLEETAAALGSTAQIAPGTGSDGGAPAPGGTGTEVLGEVVYPPGQSPAELAAAAQAAAEAAAQAAAEQAAAEAAAQAAAEQAAAEAAAAAAEQAAMVDVTYGSGTSRMYWYDSHGKRGQWVASTTFTNGWERHSFLTIEVTRTWGDGTTATHTVTGFYVPAKGSATLDVFDNQVKDNGSTKDDVVSVTVKVVTVTTSDVSWQPFSTNVVGAPYTVLAPTAR